MEAIRLYNGYGVIKFPLIDFGATDFEATPVPIALGDAQWQKNGSPFANLSVRKLAFTSGGTVEIQVGDVIEGATSGATATVGYIQVTSGSWAGGDAAGDIWFASQTGTFQAENLDVGTDLNVATIAGDSVVGMFGYVGNGCYYVVLTPTEASCEQGILTLIDQTATKEWEDQSIPVIISGVEGLYKLDFGQPVDPQVVTGAAVNTVASSYVLTTGTESANAYTDTHAVDGVHHEHTDSAGALDLYYEFSIGGDGLPTSVAVTGRINSANDSLDGVYAFNWGTTNWDRIGDYIGQASGNDVERSYLLTTAHVGTGANSGKVRVRFYAASGLTSATLRIDQILVGYAVASRTVGYQGGAIWVDTASGNTGTELYVDGVADNPVGSWADALTMNALLGLNRFRIAQGNTITLTGDTEGYEFSGENWALSLNGQVFDKCFVEGAFVFGTCTKSLSPSFVRFEKCRIGAVTMRSNCSFYLCSMQGPFTQQDAGQFSFQHCYSAVPGGGTPMYYRGVHTPSQIEFRGYSGGMEFHDLEATDSLSFEGHGHAIFNADCTSPQVSAKGIIDITDNSTGGLTEIGEAGVNLNSIAGATGALTGANAIQIRVKDDGGLLIEGVILSIYDSVGTSYKGRVETDANGLTVVFGRNPGVHTIVPAKAGYLGVSQTINVTADGIYDVTVVQQLPIAPTKPNGTVVSATLWDGKMDPVEGEKITFQVDTPSAVGTALLDGTEIEIFTDSNGLAYVELAKDTTYIVSRATAGIRARVSLGSEDAYDLTTLLNL